MMPKTASMWGAGIALTLTAGVRAAGPESIADAAMRGDRADVLAMIKQGGAMADPNVWAAFTLTGDGRHFGHLYGKRVEGVMVLRPAQYFERRARR